MPSPALFLMIATLLPLAAFITLLLIGKRMGSPLAGWMGTGFSVASFACTLIAMVKWYEGKKGVATWGFGVRPIARAYPWLPIGQGVQQHHAGFLDIGIYVDSLTVAMFGMTTLVAVIVNIYSIGYLRRDPGFARFFAYVGLLCFAILGVVISGTLVQLVVFWQGVSVSTYLLIAFRSGERVAGEGAFRAFLAQCIGDCFLMIGSAVLIAKLGNATLPILWATLGNAVGGQAVALPGGGELSTGLLTMTGMCLFFAAISKSGQFPLHYWLGDALQSPGPAVALICSAATTSAGVYLVARLFPILTPDARLFMAIIGVATLSMAALIAMVQTDIQRVLAWSTVSQLGYMILAMGIGSWVGGLFHLMTHAFFKALLFLAGGNLIFAIGAQHPLGQYGGLWRKLPVTAVTFAVAVLAIAGAPFLSGYYSLSMILTDAAAFSIYATHTVGRGWGYWLFFAVPLGVACLTAFYMTRCWMLTFAGRVRDPEAHAQAREHAGLWGPLLALAVLSVIAGYAMNIPELLGSSIAETRIMCDDVLARGRAPKGTNFTAFEQAWPALRRSIPDAESSELAELSPPVLSPAAAAHEQGHAMARAWLWWAWLIGIAPAVGIYWHGDALARRITRIPPLRWLHAWLYNAMFFDELYYWTFAKLVLGLSAVAATIDRYVIDGVSNACARFARRAIRVRRP